MKAIEKLYERRQQSASEEAVSRLRRAFPASPIISVSSQQSDIDRVQQQSDLTDSSGRTIFICELWQGAADQMMTTVILIAWTQTAIVPAGHRR